MIQRRRLLTGLLAAPAVLPAGGLLYGLPPPLVPAFSSEWLDWQGNVLARADWVRGVAGHCVPREPVRFPPGFFGGSAKAIRIVPGRIRRGVVSVSGFRALRETDGSTTMLQARTHPTRRLLSAIGAA